MHENAKLIKREIDFVSILWDNTNMLNMRLEYAPSQQVFDPHFYTSKIDVPYKSVNRKISVLSKIFELVDNNIEMVERDKKQFEVQILKTNEIKKTVINGALPSFTPDPQTEYRFINSDYYGYEYYEFKHQILIPENDIAYGFVHDNPEVMHYCCVAASPC